MHIYLNSGNYLAMAKYPGQYLQKKWISFTDFEPLWNTGNCFFLPVHVQTVPEDDLSEGIKAQAVHSSSQQEDLRFVSAK